MQRAALTMQFLTIIDTSPPSPAGLNLFHYDTCYPSDSVHGISGLDEVSKINNSDHTL